MKTRLTLKVRAGARATTFTGEYGAGWKLQVSAPPVDGKANEAITRFIAKVAGISASNVRIISGFTASTKILELEGIDSESLHRAILKSHGPPPNPGSAAAPGA